ncbi:unnamed protein product [Amoebophrya sp. A25]|nr:unnamed protein product [Amoebophrya sp. A25]|eukprot:GSA25T00007862001.1
MPTSSTISSRNSTFGGNTDSQRSPAPAAVALTKNDFRNYTGVNHEQEEYFGREEEEEPDEGHQKIEKTTFSPSRSSRRPAESFSGKNSIITCKRVGPMASEPCGFQIARPVGSVNGGAASCSEVEDSYMISRLDADRDLLEDHEQVRVHEQVDVAEADDDARKMTLLGSQHEVSFLNAPLPEHPVSIPIARPSAAARPIASAPARAASKSSTAETELLRAFAKSAKGIQDDENAEKMGNASGKIQTAGKAKAKKKASKKKKAAKKKAPPIGMDKAEEALRSAEIFLRDLRRGRSLTRCASAGSFHLEFGGARNNMRARATSIESQEGRFERMYRASKEKLDEDAGVMSGNSVLGGGAYPRPAKAVAGVAHGKSSSLKGGPQHHLSRTGFGSTAPRSGAAVIVAGVKVSTPIMAASAAFKPTKAPARPAAPLSRATVSSSSISTPQAQPEVGKNAGVGPSSKMQLNKKAAPVGGAGILSAVSPSSTPSVRGGYRKYVHHQSIVGTDISFRPPARSISKSTAGSAPMPGTAPVLPGPSSSRRNTTPAAAAPAATTSSSFMRERLRTKLKEMNQGVASLSKDTTVGASSTAAPSSRAASKDSATSSSLQSPFVDNFHTTTLPPRSSGGVVGPSSSTLPSFQPKRSKSATSLRHVTTERNPYLAPALLSSTLQTRFCKTNLQQTTFRPGSRTPLRVTVPKVEDAKDQFNQHIASETEETIFIGDHEYRRISSTPKSTGVRGTKKAIASGSSSCSSTHCPRTLRSKSVGRLDHLGTSSHEQLEQLGLTRGSTVGSSVQTREATDIDGDFHKYVGPHRRELLELDRRRERLRTLSGNALACATNASSTGTSKTTSAVVYPPARGASNYSKAPSAGGCNTKSKYNKGKKNIHGIIDEDAAAGADDEPSTTVEVNRGASSTSASSCAESVSADHSRVNSAMEQSTRQAGGKLRIVSRGSAIGTGGSSCNQEQGHGDCTKNMMNKTNTTKLITEELKADKQRLLENGRRYLLKPAALGMDRGQRSQEDASAVLERNYEHGRPQPHTRQSSKGVGGVNNLNSLGLTLTSTGAAVTETTTDLHHSANPDLSARQQTKVVNSQHYNAGGHVAAAASPLTVTDPSAHVPSARTAASCSPPATLMRSSHSDGIGDHDHEHGTGRNLQSKMSLREMEKIVDETHELLLSRNVLPSEDDLDDEIATRIRLGPQRKSGERKNRGMGASSRRVVWDYYTSHSEAEGSQTTGASSDEEVNTARKNARLNRDANRRGPHDTVDPTRTRNPALSTTASTTKNARRSSTSTTGSNTKRVNKKQHGHKQAVDPATTPIIPIGDEDFVSPLRADYIRRQRQDLEATHYSSSDSRNRGEKVRHPRRGTTINESYNYCSGEDDRESAGCVFDLEEGTEDEEEMDFSFEDLRQLEKQETNCLQDIDRAIEELQMQLESIDHVGADH